MESFEGGGAGRAPRRTCKRAGKRGEGAHIEGNKKKGEWEKEKSNKAG